MKTLYLTFTLALLFGINSSLSSQNNSSDKCGTNLINKKLDPSMFSTNNWGYGYSDLEKDLITWEKHNFVDTSHIGLSELGRKLYVLKIKDPETTSEYRVSIHARTHPNEVQAWNVTNEIINILLSESLLSKRLLNKVSFTVIPMINPDGVELNRARTNANDVDIESNWGSSSPESEVAALKLFFKELMNSELPIDIMLNMHSAYACKRYFVYHHPNGTSPSYASEERSYINYIRSYFETGIEKYDYYVSWKNGTPTRYPESWLWRNYSDRVMALTYEDMNCTAAGNYDVTAFALLSGIADYLELESPSMGLASTQNNNGGNMLNVYPNPATNDNSFFISAHTKRNVKYEIKLISTNGNVFEIPMSNTYKSGSIIEVKLSNLPKGIYLIQYLSENRTITGKVLVN